MDRTGTRGKMGSLCLVTAELAYLHKNGGIGTANWLLAHALARAGWHIHILYAGNLPDEDTLHRARQQLDRAGIGLTLLQRQEKPDWLRRPQRYWHVWQSDWVHHVLEQLHKRHSFDLVELPELGALGFRALQARRTRRAYPDVEAWEPLTTSASNWKGDPSGC